MPSGLCCRWPAAAITSGRVDSSTCSKSDKDGIEENELAREEEAHSENEEMLLLEMNKGERQRERDREHPKGHAIMVAK
jgi:hypothetical protein